MAMGLTSTDEHRRKRILGQLFGGGRDHGALTSFARPPCAAPLALRSRQSRTIHYPVQWPTGRKIGQHWHPADVNVTVMSGIFGIAVGDKFDKSERKLVKPGSLFLEPKRMHHYAWAEGTTVIQLHGEGPLVINYVNPSDDPSTTHH